LIIGAWGEELIYRVFTCSLWSTSGVPHLQVIFLAPFLFGVSHFHFYFLGDGPKRSRLNQALFQCTYTTIFGWWVAFVWSRTGSYPTIGLIHMFCNFMEFPDIDSARRWNPSWQRILILVGYLFVVLAFGYQLNEMGLVKEVKVFMTLRGWV
jgi:prenyl protein peptidase